MVIDGNERGFEMDAISVLDATVAMREEDLRIARKHAREAAERGWTPENRRAYQNAEGWVDICHSRLCDARGLRIRTLAASR
jgi:hypothetical protein